MINLLLILAFFERFIAENIKKTVIFAAFIGLFFVPFPRNIIIAGEDAMAEEQIQENNVIFPVIKEKQPKYSFIGRLTAYSSSFDQCDSNPFITASGTHVQDGIVATNCMPFGTKIKIPSFFGDKIFIVQDRMSWRYGCSGVDIWMPDRATAIHFGKASAEVLVY